MIYLLLVYLFSIIRVFIEWPLKILGFLFHFFSFSLQFFSFFQCDEIKQCVNGSDEIGCGHCSGSDMFLCTVRDQVHINLTEDVCIPQNKVSVCTKIPAVKLRTTSFRRYSIVSVTALVDVILGSLGFGGLVWVGLEFDFLWVLGLINWYESFRIRIVKQTYGLISDYC